MRLYRYPLVLILLVLSGYTSAKTEATEPKAKKVPYSLESHNHERSDPYFWMQKRDAPEGNPIFRS